MKQLAALSLMHKTILAALSAGVVTLLILPARQLPETKFEIGKLYPVKFTSNTLVPEQESVILDTEPILNLQDFVIKSGESLAVLFARLNLNPTVLHNLINTNEQTKSLGRLKIGDKISIGLDNNGEFSQLKLQKNEKETLIVNRVGNNYISHIDSTVIDTQINFAASTITTSFWNAGISAGLSPNQIMQLASIFAWDIDFALDIRKGDSFEVLYEEKVKEGEIVGRGAILAATFINQGDIFTAIRGENGNYYTPQGHAMRKAFLRSPVNFRYVSSNFNPARLHPVTGRLKAHRGTDYVAPVGTPIWAAGNGTVIKSGYNKFNGNYVFIRHSSTYITKYLHLKERLVSKGQRVKQGQEIGTLGSTGRVTGPHLHYEFLVNGVHKNPRTVDLPQAKSLTGKVKKTFMRLAKERLKQLSKLSSLLN